MKRVKHAVFISDVGRKDLPPLTFPNHGPGSYLLSAQVRRKQPCASSRVPFGAKLAIATMTLLLCLLLGVVREVACLWLALELVDRFYSRLSARLNQSASSDLGKWR